MPAASVKRKPGTHDGLTRTPKRTTPSPRPNLGLSCGRGMTRRSRRDRLDGWNARVMRNAGGNNAISRSAGICVCSIRSTTSTLAMLGMFSTSSSSRRESCQTVRPSLDRKLENGRGRTPGLATAPGEATAELGRENEPGNPNHGGRYYRRRGVSRAKAPKRTRPVIGRPWRVGGAAAPQTVRGSSVPDAQAPCASSPSSSSPQ